jgi:predicted O-methyltransferase YrrM
MPHDLRMLQWPEEVTEFDGYLKARDPRTILEIGTGPGGFIQHLGRLFPDAFLVTVDMPASGDATGLSLAACQARNKILEKEFGGRFAWIFGDSHHLETQGLVCAALAGRRADLLFLDGDDSYAGKRADWDAYRWFLSPDGVAATHDIDAKNTGVPQFWNEIKVETVPGTWVEISGGHHWGGIGIW